MATIEHPKPPACLPGGRPPCPTCPLQEDCAWAWEVLTNEHFNRRQAKHVIAQLHAEDLAQAASRKRGTA